MLMRLAGQRIVGRLRERLYGASLKQEVEFVEKGEGDVISRLSVDTSIVGERYAFPLIDQTETDGCQRHTKPFRWFEGYCDVLRWPYVASSAGQVFISCS